MKRPGETPGLSCSVWDRSYERQQHPLAAGAKKPPGENIVSAQREIYDFCGRCARFDRVDTNVSRLLAGVAFRMTNRFSIRAFETPIELPIISGDNFELRSQFILLELAMPKP